MAAGLEHIEESDEVALEVGARVLDGVADAAWAARFTTTSKPFWANSAR